MVKLESKKQSVYLVDDYNLLKMTKTLTVTDQGQKIGTITLSNAEWKTILTNRKRKSKGLKPIKHKKK